MKRDAFDMFKLIVLLVATSLLVMAYTTIEKSVAGPSEKNHVALPGVTPVAIGLVDKSKHTKVVQKAAKADYLIIQYRWQGMKLNENNSYKTRYMLLLL